MSGLIRCKACGYVMNESHLKDLCPACGLPKTVFEPYTKKIAARRKFVIDQHLHPIAVHFPQVFLLLALILPVLALIVNDPVRAEMLIIAKWSILVLPFTVLGGLVTGLVDGKIRFKKITTPLLVNKMIAGVSLLQIRERTALYGPGYNRAGLQYAEPHNGLFAGMNWQPAVSLPSPLPIHK